MMLLDIPNVETPTASAASDKGNTLAIKSPLANGDTASMLGLSGGRNKVEEEVSTQTALLLHPQPLTVSPTDALAPSSTANATTAAPAWLAGLVKADLFTPCLHHPSTDKVTNNTNFFCFDCTPTAGHGMCKLCLPAHPSRCGSGGHRMFQIRRYMHQNVVHAEDLHLHYDISGVQHYCINARRAVLIRRKASSGSTFTNRCRGCCVPLNDDCAYCSLECKVEADFGTEPPTPWAPPPAAAGAAGTRSTPSKRHHAASSAALRVATADYSEGRFSGRAAAVSDAGCCSETSRANRRKVAHPVRSPVL